MSEMLTTIHALLGDVILPKLKSIQTSQVEQSFQAEQLHHEMEEFRAELQIRFGEIRAQIAACRQEIEDALVAIRENEVEGIEPSAPGKRRLIH